MKVERIRILLIEDDAEDQLLIRRCLSNQQYPIDVVCADALSNGLSLLAQEQFDVVLTDLSLPDSFGLETVQQIRDKNGIVPIVVLTTLDDTDTELNALAAGAQDYLIKNEVTPSALVRVYRHAIQRQAAVIEAERLLAEVESSHALLAEQQVLLKRKNRKLRKLYKTAHRFVDNVSHDFRTPLTVIKDYISLVRQGMVGEINEEQGRMLDIAEIRADELNTMVDDMLDSSKLESGMLGAWRRPCQMADLTDVICRPLSRRAEVRGISFDVAIDDSLPLAYCDAEKVGRVIVNLATNAMKFCGQPGRVQLRAHVDAVCEDIVVSVTDDGPGIDEQGLAEIFKRFKQLGTRTNGSTKGFGLGLNIAKELVDLNFGQMTVQSQLGHGTTFSFSVPLNRPENIVRRYLDRIRGKRRGSTNVALIAATIREDTGNADDADAFFNFMLRQSDLLFRAESDRWLFVLRIDELELEGFQQKVEREWTKANRNRPFGPLPEYELSVAGYWDAASDSEAILTQVDCSLQQQVLV